MVLGRKLVKVGILVISRVRDKFRGLGCVVDLEWSRL